MPGASTMIAARSGIVSPGMFLARPQSGGLGASLHNARHCLRLSAGNRKRVGTKGGHDRAAKGHD